jgi:arylsulfatase A-like enzyme
MPIDVCRTRSVPYLVRLVFAGAVVLLWSCGESRTGKPAIRLIDVFTSAAVEGAPASAAARPEAAWGLQSDGGLALSEWKAGPGVTSLAVRDGKLVGRSTSELPIVYAALPEWANPQDTVDAVELRIRAGAGTSLGASLAGGAKPDFEALFRGIKESGLSMESPLTADLAAQSIHMADSSSRRLGASRILYVRPTNVAGANFEIESVRVVTRKERLEMIPSGVTWQGLGEIYRETIVSRSPEVFRLNVDVSKDSYLDLYLGTQEEGPVTFRLSASRAGSNPEEAKVLLERTITTPQRWEPTPVDLREYGGDAVTLSFALDVEAERTIGFWGNPVIRSRSARPDAPEPAAGALGVAEPPHNVLLVMCDTLRRDHLEFNGYRRETAPNLTRLASAGAVFADNISTASWTKVSTPSIVTSLYPTSHRVHDIPHRLPASATTLAEIYRGAGYATLAFCSNGFTGKSTNLHQGYEVLHESGSLADGGGKTAREYVGRFLEWVEGHRETPFFAFLHVLDPHSPFEPRAPYSTMWSDPAQRQQHADQLEKVRPLIRSPRDKERGLPRRSELLKAGIDAGAYIAYEQDWYDGSIRGMDAEMGRLVQRLRQLDLLGNTLIVFIADHGEEFHEHDRMFHSHSIYGELTNVPLFFHWPGKIPAGIVVRETTRSVDLMPTLLQLSRLAGPETMQGQSLLPLIAAAQRSGDAGRKSLLASASSLGWTPQAAVSENVRQREDDLVATSIIEDGWKLIHNKVIPEKDRPEYELFHHADDPLSLKNVAEENPEVVERLKQEMASWREQAEAAKLPETVSTEQMSAEELQRLKSLGYIK